MFDGITPADNDTINVGVGLNDELVSDYGALATNWLDKDPFITCQQQSRLSYDLRVLRHLDQSCALCSLYIGLWTPMQSHPE